MSRALFVSDIHISSSADPKCSAFLRFLEQAENLETEDLFLVGDIFDLWIADRDYFLQTYASVVEKLKSLRDNGMRIHYFEGNHDLDLVVFWQDQLGFTVHDCAAGFNIGKLRVRVEHGDQMDPSDRGYLFLRWFLRTPLLRWLGRHLPNSWIKFIGERASRASRDYTSNAKSVTEAQVKEKIETHALKAFQLSPFDLMISGHVHVADDRVIQKGVVKFRSVNLGTWLKQPLVFQIKDTEAQLLALDQFLKL